MKPALQLLMAIEPFPFEIASGDMHLLKIRLFKARQRLIEASPFLGTLTQRLPVFIVDDGRVGTAAVDGRGNCYFERAFLEQLEEPHVAAVLLHETLHLALDVFERRGTRERFRWNVAHDFAINQLIQDSELYGEVLSWPEQFPCLRDARYKGLPAEEIYRRLPVDLASIGLSEPGHGSSAGGPRWPGDALFDLWEQLDETQRESLRDAWRRKLVEAAEAATRGGKGIGSLPGWAQKLLGPILNPQVPWQLRLMNRVHGHLSGRRRTFARPGRRSHALDVVMPGPRRDRGAVGVFVDVSGSVGPEALGAFMGELQGILRDAEVPVRLITWDADVQEDLWLDEPEGVREALVAGRLQFSGGGGTDPRCVIEHLVSPAGQEHPLPSFGILLTDGYVPWPQAAEWPIDLIVVCTGQLPEQALGYDALEIKEHPLHQEQS